MEASSCMVQILRTRVKHGDNTLYTYNTTKIWMTKWVEVWKAIGTKVKNQGASGLDHLKKNGCMIARMEITLLRLLSNTTAWPLSWCWWLCRCCSCLNPMCCLDQHVWLFQIYILDVRNGNPTKLLVESPWFLKDKLFFRLSC